MLRLSIPFYYFCPQFTLEMLHFIAMHFTANGVVITGSYVIG